MKEKKVNKLARQFSGQSWQARIGRMCVVGIGYVMGLQGMTSNTGWAELPGLMTPMAFFGLLLALIGAAYTGD